MKKYIACILYCIFFSACFRSGEPNTKNNNGISSIADTSPKTYSPPSPVNDPVIDTNCINSIAGNTCIFNKSPIASAGASLNDNTINSNEIIHHQILAGSIANTSSNIFTNNSVQVMAYSKTQIIPELGQWKFPFSADNIDKISQSIAFFWFNYALQIISSRTGYFWASNKNIKIISNDAFSGWSSVNATIHLEYSPPALPVVYDAAILLYYIGIANAHFATEGVITSYTNDTHHNTCNSFNHPLKKRYCCNSTIGCSRAILSGIGEYFSALFFPANPQIGDVFTNRVSGMSYCGFSRNLNDHSNTTAMDAFQACQNQGAPGLIYPLGTVYASIWWEIRKQAVNLSVGNGNEIDTIFMLHMPLLFGSDNFTLAQQKILQIDAQFFSGKYNQIIKNEFSKRGIPLF